MSDNIEQPGEATELRKAYDTMKAQLETISTQYTQLLATTTFEKSGLNPKHAELFLKVNGDQPITVEAAKKFAEDYNLVTAPAGTPATATPAPANTSTNLASLSGAATPPQGVGGGTPQGPKMSQGEFQKMLQNDKAGALKAYAEGRVQHAEGNQLAQQAVKEGLISG